MSQEQQQFQITSMGTAILMLSSGMLFATLALIYVMLRFETNKGVELIDIHSSSLHWLVLISTAAIIIQALCSVRCRRYLSHISLQTNANALKGLKFYLLTQLVLLLIYFAAQLIWWQGLGAEGFLPSSGIYASIVYGFTWIHAGHVFIALVLLLILSILIYYQKILSTRFYSLYYFNEKFLHFLLAMWFLLMGMIFIK